MVRTLSPTATFSITLMLLRDSLVGILSGLLTASGGDSSVDIATHYGLEGPGIESRWGRDFPHLSRPALGPTQPPV